jgi:hypothetical protein
MESQELKKILTKINELESQMVKLALRLIPEFGEPELTPSQIRNNIKLLIDQLDIIKSNIKTKK